MGLAAAPLGIYYGIESGVAAYEAYSEGDWVTGTKRLIDTVDVAAGFLGGRRVLKALRGPLKSAPRVAGARFRGEPFAFGTGTREARVAKLLDEASAASRVRLADLVDEVRYVRGSSYFEVVGKKRMLAIGSNAFRKTRAGQLIEAGHEIGHAQVFNKLVRKKGFSAAVDDYFSPERSFGTPLYAREEVLVERLSLWRIRRHLGGLSPQQEAASLRYINGWRRVSGHQ